MFKNILLSVYGVKLNFTSNSNFYLEQLMKDYNYFRPKFDRASYSDANILFQIVDDLNDLPINFFNFKEMKKVKKGSHDLNSKSRIHVLNDEWIMAEALPNAVLLFNFNQSIYRGYSTMENLEIYHMITDVIMNVLSKHLLQRNIYCIHAAAVSKNNVGILFPGRSGSGKTTLSIILTKSGYKFLSDDYPQILDKSSYFELLSFPLRLKVRPDTLNQHLEFKEYAMEKKVQVERPYIDITDIFSNCLTKKAKLELLIFPNLTSELTDYRKISKEEALKKLLPCMYDPFPYLQNDISIRKNIFEFAYNLIKATESYDLFLGRNQNKIRNTVDEISSVIN